MTRLMLVHIVAVNAMADMLQEKESLIAAALALRRKVAAH